MFYAFPDTSEQTSEDWSIDADREHQGGSGLVELGEFFFGMFLSC